MLQDLMSRFQTTSQSLEHSYAELQERVRVLSAELQKERDERVRLERLAAMGEMAMELAHEIRNPLASIELYASMMRGEYAEQISRSVRLLNHTVSNTLQFGKPINPVPEPLCVAALLRRVKSFVDPLTVKKKIAIEVECEPAFTMTADPELLHRMLLNLVLNALRETPAHGAIRLTAELTGEDVLLSVEDTGPGISQKTRARIFDPMFSTHREGCGLGLSIVKRIVESHQGSIEVTSSSKGTKFEIKLRKDRNMEVVSEPVTCSR
jgi:two-component system sensor histidine kinase FlrB